MNNTQGQSGNLFLAMSQQQQPHQQQSIFAINYKKLDANTNLFGSTNMFGGASTQGMNQPVGLSFNTNAGGFNSELNLIRK